MRITEKQLNRLIAEAMINEGILDKIGNFFRGNKNPDDYDSFTMPKWTPEDKSKDPNYKEYDSFTLNETSDEYQAPVKIKNAVEKMTGSKKAGKLAGKATKWATNFVNDDPEKEEGHGFHLGGLKKSEDKKLDEAIRRAMKKVIG